MESSFKEMDITDDTNMSEFRDKYSSECLKLFWDKIFRDIRSRVLPIGKEPPKNFKLLYDISNNGSEHINVLDNYGAVIYPKYLYQQCAASQYTPRSKKKYKQSIKNFDDFTMLYIEETSICRSSKLDDLHMIEYDEEIDEEIFNRNIFISDILRPVHKLSSPGEALKRMKAFLLFKNQKDLFDVIGEMENTYITGSSIAYSMDPSQKLENYEKADIDICICCSIEEFYKNVEHIANGRKIIEKNKRSYTVDNIDIFNSPIGTIAGYHVPMVRGACDGQKFIILPSLILSIIINTMFEYRWVKTNGGVFDILMKYRNRGYKQMFSIYEKEILELENRKLHFIDEKEYYYYNCTHKKKDYIEKTYKFVGGMKYTIKEYKNGIPSYMGDLVAISNLDIYDAVIYVGKKPIIIEPGNMKLINYEFLPIKRLLSGDNTSLSTIWYGKYINADFKDVRSTKSGLFLCEDDYNIIKMLPSGTMERDKYMAIIKKKNEYYCKNFDRISGNLMKDLNRSKVDFIIIKNKIALASSSNEISDRKSTHEFNCDEFNKIIDGCVRYRKF
jgi:hypothetical protein